MVDNINNTLNSILESFILSSDEFMIPAKLIAGLGATIMAFITFRKIQMEGDVNGSINNFLIKLFLVYLGIFFYGTFLNFVNAPLNLMTAHVKEISIKDHKSTSEIFQKMVDGEDINESETNVENEEYNNRINNLLSEQNTKASEDKDSNSIFNFASSLKGAFLKFSYKFISFIASIALIILNIIRTFFLIVLSLFGIFVIAISMFPGFEGSFMQWLQKYINVYIWLPISYILEGIISRIYVMHTNDGLDNLANGTIINLLAIASILSFATIPTMSNWMINASTGGMASKVKGKGEAASQAIKKVLTKGK